MEETAKIMFSLIRYELTGNKCQFPTSDMLEDLYFLSKKHDLAHLVGDALKKNSVYMTDEFSKKFEKQMMTALFRYEQSRFALKEIKDLFEKEKIPFIPLKGSVIRDIYPEPWLRTSCDIDILIHESDLEHAKNSLVNQLEYTVLQRLPHDVSLLSPSDVHLELHFELIEDDFFSKTAIEIMNNAWQYASAEKGCSEHTFSNEFFMFFHIAHMAKHFSVGGCGIRPFIDLWLLFRSKKHKSNDIQLIKDGCLEDFYNASLRLSDVWFSSEPHDDVTLSMEKYLLGAGVYGSTENRVAFGKEKSGSVFSYMMSRIFLPYAMMKKQHPILKKVPLLLPFFHILRWLRIVFSGRLKKGVKELTLSSKSLEHEKISELMKSLGI